MLDLMRRPFETLGRLCSGALLGGKVLRTTGLLGAINPRGLVAFVRATRGMKSGPHLAPMLHASCKPGKLAIIDYSGGERNALTYGQLDSETNRLAHALVSMGVHPGDRVAILLPNSASYITALQALTRIGCAAVQIGNRLKAAEIAYILEHSEPSAVIVHHEYLDQMLAARDTTRSPDRSMILVCGSGAKPVHGAIRYEEAIASQPGDRPPPRQDTEQASVIVYTSGTTGKPKGANRRLSQTGLEAAMDMMVQLGMSHADTHLVVCPLYHSAAPAFASIILILGGTLVIAEHFDPEAVLSLIARERITCTFMVPTMLVRLSALPDEVRARHETSSLRWVLSGAAPLATDTANRFQQLFGRILFNFYGSTETALVTLAGPDDHGSRPGTVGRLLRGNEARLLGEDGREVPVGQVGELYVRNTMLISGYHRNENATNEAMREGFFSVGDLARTDDAGFVYLESRKHDMVISGGVNIYPREIEDHIHAHPDILDAAVIGVPDAEWGESLVAFVVARAGTSVSADDVLRHCRDTLATYKCPRQVEFLAELPRNPTGKVLKRDLRERLAHAPSVA